MADTYTTNYSFIKQSVGAKDWHTDMNTNLDSIDTQIKAVNDLISNVLIATNVASSGYTLTSLATLIDGIVAEIVAARGTTTTVTNRLNISLNQDGTLKSTTTASDQWPTTGMTNPTYVSATTFKVDGDMTGVLQPGTPLLVNNATDGYLLLHVKYTSYAAGPDETTITIWDTESQSNDTITSAAWGFTRSSQIGDAASAASGQGAAVRDLRDCDADYLYYAATKYQTPWTGADVAKTNSGDLARIEYESGLMIGFKYASVGGNLSSEEWYFDDAPVGRGGSDISQTHILTISYTYDGTTNNPTDEVWAWQ